MESNQFRSALGIDLAMERYSTVNGFYGRTGLGLDPFRGGITNDIGILERFLGNEFT
jgi:hypothetical protein